jgi:hypothetical protein
MASESIGSLYSTKIPSYSNTADIQAALRLYHYGSESYDVENSDTAQLVSPSIAHTLNDLQEQITGLDPAGSISKSIIDSKGDLIVGLSSDTPSKLSIGSNNFVLTADDSQTLGVKWSSLPSATTSSAGIVQLNDSFTSTSTSLAATANTVKLLFDSKEDKALTINDQSGVTYTLVATDANSKLVRFTSNLSVGVTVPPNVFTAGQQINITQYGDGQVVIGGGSGVTVNATPSLILRAKYSAATIVCIDPTTFIMYGDLAN